jgi:predicted porin
LKAISAETVQGFKDLPLADFKYFLVGEDRENNIIQYTTPTFSGFGVSAQVEPGEDSGQDNASKSHTNHGIADKYSLAATYKWQTLYLALANTHNVQNTNIVRAVGQYGIGPVSIGALWQKADRNFSTTSTGAVNTIGSLSGLPVNNTNASNGNPITDFTTNYKSQDGYVLSLAWKIDAVTLKGQYGHSSSEPDSAALSDTKAKNYVLGADYKLNDNSKVFAYYAVIDTDGDNKRIDGNLKDKTFAVGYDFKF